MAEQQQHGVKETKEVIKLGFALSAVVAGELKDGFQLQDLVNVFTKLQGNDEKKAIVEAALKDVKIVPEEIKDLSLIEGIELAAFAAAEVPALLEALKK